ncbi:hypothetical protein P7C71_g5030, partial [Lecanoromycetidae sp. Uapishka_2]
MTHHTDSSGSEPVNNFQGDNTMIGNPPNLSQLAPAGNGFSGTNGGAISRPQSVQTNPLSTGTPAYGPYNPGATSFQPTAATRHASAVSTVPNQVHTRAPQPVNQVTIGDPRPMDPAIYLPTDHPFWLPFRERDRAIAGLSQALDASIASHPDPQLVAAFIQIKFHVTIALANVGAEWVLPQAWYSNMEAQ